MYQLTLENNIKVKIHEDLILKYDLLLKKELDEKTLLKIRDENFIYEVYEIAFKYMKIRLRSQKEIEAYLKKKEYPSEVIASVLSLLKERGDLDDNMYATSYLHDKMLMSHDGPNKIRGELEKVGISTEIIEKVMPSYTEELEKEKIEKLVQKQIKTNHSKGSMLLKKKIQSYLTSLGYSSMLINQVLNGKKLVSEDLYQKEYEKQKKLLSKKYSGKELEYKLKQKMYQKGFSNDFWN